MKHVSWCIPVLACAAGWLAGKTRPPDKMIEVTALSQRQQSGAQAPSEVAVHRLWEQGDVDGMLDLLCQMSPQAAYETLFRLPGNVGELLAKLVKKQGPDTGKILLEVFLRHPEHHHTFGIANTVFRHAAQGDPALAWKEAEAHAMHFLPAMIPALAQGMTRKDPLEAIGHASAIRSPGMRERFVNEVLEEWSGTDAATLLTWLARQPDVSALSRLVKWGRMRISTAAQLGEIARLLPVGAVQNITDSRLMFDTPADDLWIRRTDWLLAMPRGEERERLCGVAALSLISVDPEAAVLLLPALNEQGIRRQVLTAVAGFRAAASPQEGLAFADTLQDARERESARLAVFFTWAENDPSAAARHALAADDPEAKRMLSTAGIYWAAKDPEGAALFAFENDLPQSGKTSGLSGLLSSAVQGWATRDPVAAANWVNALPREPQRDRAAAALATSVARQFPEEAMLWARDIADESLRREAVGLCFSTWLMKQPDQAALWLESAALDETTHQRLTSALQSRRGRPYPSVTHDLTQGTMVIY